MAIQVNVPYSANPQFIPEFTDKPYPYSTDWQLAITNAVTQNYTAILAGLSDPTTTTGDMLYRGISGLTRLPIGSANQVLSTQSGIPTWATISTLLGISGTGGRILYWNGTSIISLPTPVASSVLTHSGVSGTAPSWSASGLTGFISGPASSIDNRIMLFSGTTGKVAKMSGATISAANALTGISSATLTAGLTAMTGTFSGLVSAAGGTFTTTVSSTNHTFSGTSTCTGLSGSYQVLRGGSTMATLTASGSSAPLGAGLLRLNGPVGGVFGVNTITISGNSDQANTGTPSVNTQYGRNIVKCSGNIDSSGSIIRQFNISSTVKLGTGFYRINYKTSMSTNFNEIVVSPTQFGPLSGLIANVRQNGAGFFEVDIKNGAGTLVDASFSIIVIGVQ
jgi:hypothetical protein